MGVSQGGGWGSAGSFVSAPSPAFPAPCPSHPPLPPARPLPCCPRSARLVLGPAPGFSAHSGPLRAPSFALQLGVCVEQMTAVGGHTRVDTPVSWGGFRGICVQVLLVSKKEGWGRGGVPWGTRLGGW